MHVILTHEQADFDALASMLGAYLLDESAIPVLPHRINRNVRSFLAFYGSELPFVELRDIPSGNVDLITLVDTQSLVTIKGMNDKTQVRAIDHHPLRSGLPSNWMASAEEVGATTTLFVEKFEETALLLSSVQATMLLLGIYEDTGSLTYSRTTPRDVRAAAFLLEVGADLGIMTRFLNPPLSLEQRVVYDKLLSSARLHQIQGHRVIITSGISGGTVEEISSLSHKLRDLLDPDALFVLVSSPEGIRLVARSSVEGINVGAVAAHFGGGGHERAAAALIKISSPGTLDESMLEQVEKELLLVIPRFIRPSVTVGQIMSRRPYILAPVMPVQEAGELMRKYGYEGFPVVDNDKVVGLLTRRSVDRALAHKLNLSAASLMDAGNVTVSPGDSLQHLQAVMTDTGWGQIPVVDEKGFVVGIVTRTDLLKTLAPRAAPGSRPQNLAKKLEHALPAEHLALLKGVIKVAANGATALFIVGGFVRDLLLDRPSLDFDLVVEGDAISLAKAIAHHFGGRVTSHSRFGTAKWFLDESVTPQLIGLINPTNLPPFLDFISARTEFYEHPTALPTVERGSIKLDLHRRDFTINTICLRLDGRHYGELLDFWGGYSDLRAGLVRVLHSLSFVDDPTRMLRAVRFEKRFNFTIETRTRQLMNEACPLLAKLSSERVGHEIDLILDEIGAVSMLQRLDEIGLLQYIHSSMTWNAKIRQRMTIGLETPPPASWGNLPTLRGMPFRRGLAYLLWFYDLPSEEIHSVSNRLRLPIGLRVALLAAHDLMTDLDWLGSMKPSEVYARMEDVPPISIFINWLVASEKERQVLDNYVTHWRKIKPFSNGQTLKSLGLSPGPRFRKIIRTLRDAWLDGLIHSEDEEKKLLESLM